MAVDWDIPLKMERMRLQELQVLGQERSRDIENRTAMDRLMELGRQREARPQIQQQIARGDYRRAQAAAVAVGDNDLAANIGRLGEDDRKRLAAENETFGRAAFALRRVPADMRGAAFKAMLPRLAAAGFSEEELAGYSDFSDEALDGHIALSQSVRDTLAGDLTQARIDDVGFDNDRADRLATNTVENTQNMMADRAARRALTARGQDLADSRGRYSVSMSSADRRRGQDMAHQDRVAAREDPRRGGRSRRLITPNNPPSMIPGATPEMPVTVTDVAQARLLPKGTYFRNPEGRVMQR